MRRGALSLLLLALAAAPLAADPWADANALLGRGDAVGAAKAYEALGPQPAKRREAWRRNNWGLALLRLNKPAAAVEQLELALGADPRNFIARSNLGGAYERVGDRLKARDVYARALELLREDIKALSQGRGSRLPDAAAGQAAPETPSAQADLEKAASLRGEALKAALRDASDLMDAGQYQAAADAYAAIGQTAPAKREGWRLNNWALCALRLGEPQAAYQRLRRAVEADPDNSTAWSNLAIACESLGLADEARQAWGRSGQEAGEDGVDPLRFELARLKLDLAAERRRWEALTR